MIRTAFTAVSTAMLVTSAYAAPCRDAKGHFMKCGAAASAMTPAVSNVIKDKAGKCHVASGANKGKFTACPK